ncbi:MULTISPECIES: hypothetical protein [Paracoccus]|uniref:Uncharacterized protein n=1 Tax=Paracoccus hibiscisoli TaxID=2023261 RepID=A0A4U0QUT3_9RHOB|nr:MULTISPECIES: hypothetical protein [Paracoccus]ODT60600.1 MAG: hypothetical protein ABS73_04695 [Paracoccus sp. SCN 68-21]TJZ85913.1 hypothetical protein FA740_05835 [Paracoccus hibiscisoli]
MSGIGADILGVIAVAVGAFAVLYAGMHAARKAGLSPPPWLLTAGIGLSMVSYSVWNDYAWFDRARAALPEGAQVLVVGRASQVWAPWTYLAPVEVRFAALDPGQITDAADGTRSAPIMLVERRGQTVIVPQDFDCSGARIRPARGDWMPAGDDAAFATVCPAGGSNG